MTDELIARLQALQDAATPGPWRSDLETWGDPADVTIYGGNNYVVNVWSGKPDDPKGVVAFDAIAANAALIVALRNALPEIIEAVRDAGRIDWAQDNLSAVRESVSERCTISYLDRRGRLRDVEGRDFRAAIDAAKEPR